MIKHIVMWRLHDSAQGNDKKTNAKLIKEKLESLRGKMPGVLAIEVGLDFSESSDSSDIVLYSEFESREALDLYQAHPLHKEVMPFVMASRCERRLVDYEVS